MITLATLQARRGDLLSLAHRYRAERVRVFGSVARGETHEKSDVDLLVHFSEGASLFDLMDFQEEAETLLQAHVDVVSDEGLSPYLKDKILRDAVDL
jgi:predicted nucleotidyltransferase